MAAQSHTELEAQLSAETQDFRSAIRAQRSELESAHLAELNAALARSTQEHQQAVSWMSLRHRDELEGVTNALAAAKRQVSEEQDALRKVRARAAKDAERLRKRHAQELASLATELHAHETSTRAKLKAFSEALEAATATFRAIDIDLSADVESVLQEQAAELRSCRQELSESTVRAESLAVEHLALIREAASLENDFNESLARVDAEYAEGLEARNATAVKLRSELAAAQRDAAAARHESEMAKQALESEAALQVASATDAVLVVEARYEARQHQQAKSAEAVLFKLQRHEAQEIATLKAKLETATAERNTALANGDEEAQAASKLARVHSEALATTQQEAEAAKQRLLATHARALEAMQSELQQKHTEELRRLQVRADAGLKVAHEALQQLRRDNASDRAHVEEQHEAALQAAAAAAAEQQTAAVRHEAQILIDTLSREHTAHLLELEAQHSTTVTSHEAHLENLVDTVETVTQERDRATIALEHAQQAATREMKSLEDDLAAESAHTLEQTVQAAVELKARQNQAEVQELLQLQGENMAVAKAAFVAELQAAKTHENQVAHAAKAALEAEADSCKTALEIQLEEVEAMFASQESNLRATHTEQLQQADARLVDARAMFDAEMENVKEAHLNAITSHREAWRRESDAHTFKMVREALENAKDHHEAMHHDALQQALASRDVAWEANLGAVTAECAATARTQREEADAAIKALETELELETRSACVLRESHATTDSAVEHVLELEHQRLASNEARHVEVLQKAHADHKSALAAALSAQEDSLSQLKLMESEAALTAAATVSKENQLAASLKATEDKLQSEAQTTASVRQEYKDIEARCKQNLQKESLELGELRVSMRKDSKCAAEALEQQEHIASQQQRENQELVDAEVNVAIATVSAERDRFWETRLLEAQDAWVSARREHTNSVKSSDDTILPVLDGLSAPVPLGHKSSLIAKQLLAAEKTIAELHLKCEELQTEMQTSQEKAHRVGSTSHEIAHAVQQQNEVLKAEMEVAEAARNRDAAALQALRGEYRDMVEGSRLSLERERLLAEQLSASHNIARQAAASALESAQREASAARVENHRLREARSELIVALHQSEAELSSARNLTDAVANDAEASRVLGESAARENRELLAKIQHLSCALDEAQAQLQVITPVAAESQQLRQQFLALRAEVDQMQETRHRELERRNDSSGCVPEPLTLSRASVVLESNVSAPNLLQGSARGNSGVADALKELEVEQAKSAALLAEELSLRDQSGSRCSASPSSSSFNAAEGEHVAPPTVPLAIVEADAHRSLRLSDIAASPPDTSPHLATPTMQRGAAPQRSSGPEASYSRRLLDNGGTASLNPDAPLRREQQLYTGHPKEHFFQIDEQNPESTPDNDGSSAATNEPHGLRRRESFDISSPPERHLDNSADSSSNNSIFCLWRFPFVDLKIGI